MDSIKRFPILQRILLTIVQTFFIVVWFYFLDQHELISKEGYQYSKYNGIYFLCGVIAVIAMWDNLAAGISISKKNLVVLGIFSGVYAVATVMANYPVFERMFTGGGGNPLGLFGSLTGGWIVAFHILTCALRRLPLEVRRTKPGVHAARFYCLTFASIAMVYLLYFFCVAYPGYFTRDSFSAIEQCMEGVFDNISPYYHTRLVGLCIQIGEFFGGQGNSAVCAYGIFQCLLMAAIFSYALVTLYQAGIPKWCVFVVYGMYTFLSYNLAYSATMWKDIPFSGFALVILTALYRILKGIGKNSKLNYIIFVVGGIGFCLMRTNGWYSYLITTLVIAMFVGASRKRMLLTMCGVLAATWICLNPVLDVLGVTESNSIEALSIPFQQISRVVVEDCEIAPEDMALIEQVFNVEKVKALYDPLTVDPIKFEAFRWDQLEFFQSHKWSYFSVWLRLGIQHPWEYIKAWVDETQGYWNAGYHFWIYPGGENPEYGIIRPEMNNPVADAFQHLVSFLEATPPITQPLYGIGFQVWILIFCTIVNVLKKREEHLLSILILVIVIGLWLGAPVFAEFRYAYPVFVTVPVLLCLTFFERPSQESADATV